MTSPNDNWHAPAWFKGSELELRALLEAMDHGDGTNKRTTRNKAEWALLTKVFEDYDAAISKSEDKLIAQLETKAKINDLVAQFVVRDKAAFKRFLQRLRQLKIPFTRLTEADEYDVDADLQQLRLRSEEATQARAESLAHMADEKSPTRGHELKTKRFFGHDDVLALMVMVGWTPESPVGSRSKKKAFKNADAEEDEGAAAAEEREGSPDPHRPSAVAEFLFVRQAWMYFFEFVESSRSTPGRCEKYFPGGKFPDWFPSAEYFDSA